MGAVELRESGGAGTLMGIFVSWWYVTLEQDGDAGDCFGLLLVMRVEELDVW